MRQSEVSVLKTCVCRKKAVILQAISDRDYMTKEDILHLCNLGEQTTVQFKERITPDNKYDVGCEMVALSNTLGGLLIIGINDKTGCLNPLSFAETQETIEQLGNLSSENVVPSILITTENVSFEDGTIVVATIKQGSNRPYHDNKGIIWVKQGADKRRVFDNTELANMMMECHRISPDAVPIKDTTYADLDENTMREYFSLRFRSELERQSFKPADAWHMSLDELANLISNGQTPASLLTNVGLILPDGTLTLAALMLMGKFPQRYLPVFTVRCISFVGNSIGGKQFRDKSGSDADGNALHLYRYIMSFLTRNLRQVQAQPEFNSQGTLEISTTTLSELVVNAILHRSYIIEAPLRIFIFDNRVEIHSPGLLPEGVNTENIRSGISVPRNKLLFNHGIHLLPYTGAGSGIIRAINDTPNIHFENNTLNNEFVITIDREDIPEELIIKNPNLDTNLDTDLDTNLDTDLVTDSVTTHDTTPVTKEVGNVLKLSKLNGKQKDILNFCSVPRSAKEILERVGVINHTKNRKKHVLSLVELGFLEMTNPENPNASNQKYVRAKRSKK